LSGEYSFSLRDESVTTNIKSFLGKYFQSVDVKIVLLVRNPLAWMISVYQQNLSGGQWPRNMRSYDRYDDLKSNYFDSINNSLKAFGDSLVLLKFEDTVKDEDGLVGCFLKTTGFPEDEIKKLNITRENESRSLEAMELISFIDGKEPYIPSGYGGPNNPRRSPWDTAPLCAVKGAKFDFAYKDKLALWERLKEPVRLLKENTGIDYTGYKVEEQPEPETYTEETINGFIEAFPKLSPVLQKLFLEFFEKKYAETAQKKFKKLYFQGTIPNKIYELSQAVQNLKNDNASLQGTINTLHDTVNTLRNENTALHDTINTLRNENTALHDTINTLQHEIAALHDTINTLQHENLSLKENVSVLQNKTLNA
jgi:cell division protein FtsB